LGRPLRATSADVVYYVLNRANARMTLFDEEGDYTAFERVLREACEHGHMRLLAYCVMPNHWHLVVWPRRDGDLSRFLNWLTLTHTQRCHQHRHSVGEGHVYQGRFKSFPVETNEYLLTVCQYVERNPVRAGLVARADQRRWSSAGSLGSVLLHPWPMERPAQGSVWVNEEEATEPLRLVRKSIMKGQPFGSALWVEQMVTKWNLGATLRERGRRKKELVNNDS